MICFLIFRASLSEVASLIPIFVRLVVQFFVKVPAHISLAPGLVISCRHFWVSSSSIQSQTCSMSGLAGSVAVWADTCSIVLSFHMRQSALVTVGFIAIFSFPCRSVLSMVLCSLVIILFRISVMLSCVHLPSMWLFVSVALAVQHSHLFVLVLGSFLCVSM